LPQDILYKRSAESRFEAMHTTGLTALVGREKESELLLRGGLTAMSRKAGRTSIRGSRFTISSRIVLRSSKRANR
jgi:hypothetical protein